MKRIGYITGSSPEDLPYDFGNLVPDGVQMIGAYPAQSISVMTPQTAAAAELGLGDAAVELVERGADAIVISIAPLIYVNPPGYDQILIGRIRDLTGRPTTTNQTASIDGLRALGVTRVVIVNPNTSDLLAKQVLFFEGSGMSVAEARSLDIASDHDIDCLPAEQSHRFIREAVAAAPDADGIYLSGPCWRTVRLIDRIERETGLPVVTALQATVWAGMRLVGLEQLVPGHGRLMRMTRRPAVSR
jgi:maleate cis-trans isomerase